MLLCGEDDGAASGAGCEALDSLKEPVEERTLQSASKI